MQGILKTENNKKNFKLTKNLNSKLTKDTQLANKLRKDCQYHVCRQFYIKTTLRHH